MSNIEIYNSSTENISLFEQTKVNELVNKVSQDHFFAGVIVSENEQAMAKAALYINPYLEYKSRRVGTVGSYCAVENKEYVFKLFQTIENLAKEQGLDYLIGPMNGSTWEDYRFHETPEKPLFFTESKHPIYYSQQWQEIGFRVVERYYSSETDQIHVDSSGISTISNGMDKLGVVIRKIDLESYEEELDRLYTFLLQAFDRNFLYTPISKQSFLDKYLPLKTYLQPDYVLIAEHNQQTVGLFMCVKDFFDTEQETLIIKTIARDSNALYRGLGHVMAKYVYDSAHRNGIQRIIHAFLKEEGTSTPISRNFFGRPFKTYSLYGKEL